MVSAQRKVNICRNKTIWKKTSAPLLWSSEQETYSKLKKMYVSIYKIYNSRQATGKTCLQTAAELTCSALALQPDPTCTHFFWCELVSQQNYLMGGSSAQASSLGRAPFQAGCAPGAQASRQFCVSQCWRYHTFCPNLFSKLPAEPPASTQLSLLLTSQLRIWIRF